MYSRVRCLYVKPFLVVFACVAVGCSTPSRALNSQQNSGVRVEFGPLPTGPTATPFHTPVPLPVLRVPLGKILWHRSFDKTGGRSSFTMAAGRLVVANSHGLATYDATSGARISTNGTPLEEAVGVGDDLYGLDASDRVVRFDARTGRVLWRRTARAGSIVADSAGAILLGRPDEIGRTAFISYRRDGTVAWQTPFTAATIESPIRFVGHDVIVPWFSDGARMAQGFYSIDRRSGKVYGSYGAGAMIGLRSPDVAYAREDFFGDLDFVCCTVQLDTVELSASHAVGNPPSVALQWSTRTIDPDARENMARVTTPCAMGSYSPPSLASNRNADIAKVGDGFAFWAVGRLYDVSAVAVEATVWNDECPLGASTGNAMLASRRDSVDVVTRRNGSLVVSAVLPVKRSSISTALVAGEQFFVQVGPWLYAIESERERSTKRWNVSCREWTYVGRFDRDDILLCRSLDSSQSDHLYALE